MVEPRPNPRLSGARHELDAVDVPPQPAQPTRRLPLPKSVIVIGIALAVAAASQSVFFGVGATLLGLITFPILGIAFVTELIRHGVVTFRAQGPSTRVTVLYSAAYLAAIIIATSVFGEFLPNYDHDGFEVVIVAIGMGFAALAFKQRLPSLLKVQLLALPLYQWLFFGTRFPGGFPSLILPLGIVIATWFYPLSRNPRDVSSIRVFAALAVCMCSTAWAFLSGISKEPVPLIAPPALFILAAATLVYGEVCFSRPEAKDTSWGLVCHFFCVYLAPLWIINFATALHNGWAAWSVPTAIAAMWLMSEFAPRLRTPSGTPNPSLDSLRAVWMVTLAFAIISQGLDTTTTYEDAEIRWLVVVAVYATAFLAVCVFLRHRDRNEGIVFMIWVYGTLAAADTLLAASMGAASPQLAHWTYACQAILIAAIIAVCVLQRDQMKRFHKPLAIASALALLPLSVMAVVPLVSFVAHKLAPTNPDAVIGGFYAGHALISVAWIALAAWILLSRRNLFGENGDVLVGLALGIAGTLKLVLFDLATLGVIPRVLAFIVSGLLLIAVSVVRARTRPQQPSVPVPPPGIGR